MDHDSQSQRQLELIRLLDTIRDAHGDGEDPTSMFVAITELMASRFEASACGLVLLAEQDSGIECVAATGIDAEHVLRLGQQVFDSDGECMPDAETTPTMLTTAITLNDECLGAMILTRPGRSFDEADRALLEAAESQIDSAVIQARTIWKYRQRNRELEAIHAIDQLRDGTTDESELLAGSTSVLLKYFQPELCMIILRHHDSGEMVARDMVDKTPLPPETMEFISRAAQTLESPALIPSPPGAENLYLLGAPLMVKHSHLGTVVVGRMTRLLASDQRLLAAIAAQIDSAVVYVRVHQQLRQRNRELEIIYRIDRIRDQEADFDTLLQKVLHELCNVISGEIGYIMLYTDREETPLELKAATVEGVLTQPEYARTIQAFSRQALDRAHLIYDNQIAADSVRSIVAVPLILHNRIIGVFGAINSKHPRGFTGEDRRLLTALTSQVDTAIFERLEQRRMRALLSRSVDPNVLNQLLQQTDPAHMLAGERRVLSVLYGDLRGSTQWVERTEPEELVGTLNQFLGKMTDVIFKYGGTLDKFVGDEVIGLFGSPLFMADHADRAAAAALEMQQAHRQLVADLAAQGHELPPMGIGISSGEAITGEFGPPIRTDFTAVGQVMNLGARLCSAAGPGQIFLSQATYDLVKSRSDVRVLEPLTLKGISHPAPVYELIALKEH